MVKEATLASLLACMAMGYPARTVAAPGFIGEHVVLQLRGAPAADDVVSHTAGGRSAAADVVEPLVLAHSRIAFSVDGFRALSTDGVRQSLSDYATRRVWLVDRVRRAALQIHLPGELPTLKDLPDGLEPAALLATTPCVGQTAHARDPVRWRGREVVPYACLDAAGTTTITQSYSAELGMVIRTESPDGRVEEFRRIEKVDLSPTYFVLPSGYRTVDLREFRFGAGSLARSVELQ